MLAIEKNYLEPSVFKPENLLREARRQKTIPDCKIPRVCILDPDGDIVDYLIKSKKASLNRCWSCYHTKMYAFEHDGMELGIIGSAVGASFAVLLAEQMFVSGCELLISMTSAGVINPPAKDIRFILINESLRDEGTSYHYLPPGEKAAINPALRQQLQPLMNKPGLATAEGNSWTTDAPYRETKTSIEYAKNQGVTAVEMEASALYAFAKAHQKNVVCFAHLTNNMAQDTEDFEKGTENGSIDSLGVIYQTIACLI
ncbi:nucleoside phosphorylase [Fulvivirgaceae bacterium BMA12]|uniref:Nucleoside phosphorylase n=1 Tax=Agaribacillus aureus TaxID=3051825 RepID=A0ABT8LGE4_9BACT|nr:nucleoside phosphorylase [Fulvivirgaceae bacterium BMA12]